MNLGIKDHSLFKEGERHSENILTFEIFSSRTTCLISTKIKEIKTSLNEELEFCLKGMIYKTFTFFFTSTCFIYNSFKEFIARIFFLGEL